MAATSLLLATACNKKENMSNPFLGGWNTPYNIPDFDKIKPEHYMPAFEAGMAQEDSAIAAIVASRDAPTFQNTIEAMEYAGPLLKEVSATFFNLYGTENNEHMESIAEEITPRLSQHRDNILLNADLFRRVKTVYDQREELGLDNEQMRLLEETYKGFVRGGANVPADQQTRFREVNSLISSLEMRFGQNLLKATNDYQLVLDKDQLAGLSDASIAAAKELGDEKAETRGKYVFTLQLPSWEPFMMSCRNRDLREQMWLAYTSRCNGGKYDNNAIIDSLANLRLERAKILGYDNFAAYVLDDNLAKTPENVYKCLTDIWKPSLKKAKAERDEYQRMIVVDEGKDARLQPWDWRYYSEKLRKERYDMNDDSLRPYFPLDGVLKGAFNVANRLYGLTFEEVDTLPTYDKEARSFLVKDSGKVCAILYMDFFPRASKQGGAWMTNFREQYIDRNGNNVIPIISIVTNFTKPQGDTPALLNFDQSQTLFHEFGHALHGMLSRCHYSSISGTNVPRDFVEMPSQIMENWCRNSQVMREFAKHYKTGEVIPDALIKKLEDAGTYGSGFMETELLAASFLDMDYHTITEAQKIDPVKFEEQAMNKIGLIPEIISRYKSSYYQHVFGGGYCAGYYAYTWTAILDADAFSAFEESGDLYNPELARKLRYMLSKGNTMDLMQLYRDFRGKDPDATALLKRQGLL